MAERSDSIAPSAAMVKAGPIKSRMSCSETAGKCSSGKTRGNSAEARADGRDRPMRQNKPTAVADDDGDDARRNAPAHERPGVINRERAHADGERVPIEQMEMLRTRTAICCGA